MKEKMAWIRTVTRKARRLTRTKRMTATTMKSKSATSAEKGQNTMSTTSVDLVEDGCAGSAKQGTPVDGVGKKFAKAAIADMHASAMRRRLLFHNCKVIVEAAMREE